MIPDQQGYEEATLGGPRHPGGKVTVRLYDDGTLRLTGRHPRSLLSLNMGGKLRLVAALLEPLTRDR